MDVNSILEKYVCSKICVKYTLKKLKTKTHSVKRGHTHEF